MEFVLGVGSKKYFSRLVHSSDCAPVPTQCVLVFLRLLQVGVVLKFMGT